MGKIPAMRADNSEIIPYNFEAYRVFVGTEKMSDHTNMRMFRHWHDDIELDIPLTGNMIFSVKISIPLENTGVYSVFATSFWPFSLIFSLARRNEGNFFHAVPTTLSSSLAEVRLASLVAWA